MNRRFILEATTLVVAAILCAVVANAMASRERKLKLVPTPIPVRAAVPSPATTATATVSPLPDPVPEVPNSQPLTTTSANPTGTVQKSAAQKEPVAEKPATQSPKPAKSFPPHPDKT